MNIETKKKKKNKSIKYNEKLDLDIDDNLEKEFEKQNSGKVIKKLLKVDENIKEIKYIDLFCGLGAFHYAFNKMSNKQINYKCVFACDIDDDVIKLYYDNYNIKPHGDINLIDYKTIPNFDILCAGFPCQPFSIAGKKEGFDDKVKGNLFFKILEIIDVKNPNTLILENVKNLKTIDNGKIFDKIIVELEKRKYIVSYKVIDSKYYGSPQSRKRIFIVCNKIKKYVFSDIKKKIVNVSSIIDNSVDNFFEYDKNYNLEPNNNKNSNMIYKLVNKKTGKGGRQGERVYTINSYGPTICASSGGPGAKTGLYKISNKIRTLTINETLKMFGFDENYKYDSIKHDNKLLYFLGNSIVVNVLIQIITDLEKIF